MEEEEEEVVVVSSLGDCLVRWHNPYPPGPGTSCSILPGVLPGHGERAHSYSALVGSQHTPDPTALSCTFKSSRLPTLGLASFCPQWSCLAGGLRWCLGSPVPSAAAVLLLLSWLCCDWV